MSDTPKVVHGPPPKRLYKYFSFSGEYEEYSRQLLTDCQIYFASPIDFNDPFDCAVTFSSEGVTDEEYRKFILEYLKHNRPDINQLERIKLARKWIRSGEHRGISKNLPADVAKNMGVYCLSACPDDILMWSHYADKHRGYVIEFKAEPNYFPFSNAHQVSYASKYESVNILQDSFTRIRLTLLTKSKKWIYEQEFRVIQTFDKPRIADFSPSSLSGIYFGCKMTEENKVKVRDVVAKGNCNPKYYQYIRSDSEYKLDLYKLV